MATALSPRRELEMLQSTNSAVMRDQLALRLAETGNPRVFDILLRLIERPETRGHRGTLVHCLSYFDAKPAFLPLIGLVIHDNFETAHEAFQLLESIDEVSGTEAADAEQRVSAALRNRNEAWRKDLLGGLAKMFA